MAYNLDGIINVLTNLGTKKDSKSYNRVQDTGELNNEYLEAIFRSEGIGRKIVSRPVFDMLRAGWLVEGDKENDFEDVYDSFSLVPALADFYTWDRLFGGALLILGINDGGKLEDELNWGSIKGIEFVRAVDRSQIKLTEKNLQNDSSKKDYGKPLSFVIKREGAFGEDYTVHASRAFALYGSQATNRMRARNCGFGGSVLSPIHDYITRYVSSLSYTETAVQDFVQNVLKISNLQSLLMNSDGESIVQKRIEILDLSRTVLNTMLLGEGESYEKKTSSVSGLKEIIEEFQYGLSAVAEIPATLLFGRSPSGMNATGESDFQDYYDKIRSDQKTKLKPCLNWINDIIRKSSDYKIPNETYGVKFNPLSSPTEKEIVETRKAQSETDENYFSMGVLSREEIRENRFSGEYSLETSVQGSALTDIPPDGDE